MKPEGSISSLAELRNIVLLKLDVWLVTYKGNCINLGDLSIHQGTCGQMLHSSDSGDAMYIEFLGVNDPTFDKYIKYDRSHLNYIFNTMEDAMTYHDSIWKGKVLNGQAINPRGNPKGRGTLSP